ncbi:hypothetical protein A2W48_00160 [Candidatus Giovannonibacteria bacterium RIFCSPHIGHO2_12_44_12]|uniref:Uncharacterized protein n=4 Tax=Candidatus Giovannoniibacteriota TaxID=1752738 RepID=A0A1F5X1J9_9BACT|nr:MAG: hypothetical protein UX06_C0048G0007 [Candidatus Giovannonibacteria bacterium GW2011_GWA2_45_21]OGF73519.1 MAG: hypothetical protein A2W57_03440 [Candidatus Giovannonibacteria bacterium RIFCSPHIGHO2_02_43_16]OGF81778.1 MAG: hypothetical protein A2W48_00160 [Candidatus Giovannonibacteria bacterium RIFCSPHIGHO2_12_44_12]OGF95702.1 MAG: hypothetical protein A2Y47_01045 [Candidatus Giovannonibacteria bacterium RIFCSPLOWO2_12_43_8]
MFLVLTTAAEHCCLKERATPWLITESAVNALRFARRAGRDQYSSDIGEIFIYRMARELPFGGPYDMMEKTDRKDGARIVFLARQTFFRAGVREWTKEKYYGDPEIARAQSILDGEAQEKALTNAK